MPSPTETAAGAAANLDLSLHTPMMAQYMGVISKLLSQINFL